MTEVVWVTQVNNFLIVGAKIPPLHDEELQGKELKNVSATDTSGPACTFKPMSFLVVRVVKSMTGVFKVHNVYTHSSVWWERLLKEPRCQSGYQAELILPNLHC